MEKEQQQGRYSYMFFNWKRKIKPKPKVNEVIFFGSAFYSSQIKKLFKQVDIKIIGTIDSYNDFKKLSRLSKNAPITCGYIAEHEKGLFLETLSFCRDYNRDFLHPASILPLLTFPKSESTKIKTYGFPGSGNMLLEDFLQDHIGPLKYSEHENLLVALGSHYHNFLMDIFKRSIRFTKTNAKLEISPSNTYYGSIIVTKLDRKASFVMARMPVFAFSWSRLICDHAFVKRETITFYNDKQFKQVAIVRHPLDTIFSDLTKINCFQYDSNSEFFELITYYYSLYLQCITNNMEDLYILKYEDLVTETEETILKLCEHVGIDVTLQQITSWKKERLFKTLPRVNEGHFCGGGTDKWRGYFTKDSYHILKKYNITEYAKQLGYNIEPSWFAEKRTTIPQIDEKNNTYLQIKAKLHTHFLTFWSLNSDFKKIKTPHNNELIYYENNYGDEIDTLINNETFLQWIDSGSIIDNTKQLYHAENIDFFKDTAIAENL